MKTNSIRKSLFALSLVALTSLSGCAQLASGAMNSSVTDEEVAVRTAKHFGVERKNVVISDVKRSMSNTDYTTKVGGKHYNCYLFFEDVKCKQPGA